ncbi:MAG: pyridoxamine 5'-phosphate oxidase [Pleurocapsa sp. CRU_1_2]|nr:pyridoxamine 5'-phosphate oxidase [Pleurocapsa sp. CRU_1_2]
MTEDPIQIFQNWYAEATQNSPLQHPKAVCVSTINPEGIPEARFVALKAVSTKGFTFCSSLNSAKSIAIALNSYVALTFWWDHIERQVRVKGTAKRISDEDADKYFQERHRDAQLTSVVSEQSALLENSAQLEQKLHEVKKQLENREIPRPDNWGGYCIKPISIEFLRFQTNRFHNRLLFTFNEDKWSKQLLQP